MWDFYGVKQGDYRGVLSSMDRMLKDIAAKDPGNAHFRKLQEARSTYYNFSTGRRPDTQMALSFAEEFQGRYNQWSVDYSRREAARVQKELEAARKKQEAEQAAALERQRQEMARLQTYQSNVGHGDLTGPGTPPTVISGGSQNVDASRLDIGRSSTARRRRGRGISAQLGL